MHFTRAKSSLGFTLIELLVVIAIIGVLAGTMIVIINPLEQLARGRDAGRKTTVNQLGNALQGYYASQNSYPLQSATWMGDLQSSGEIKTLPVNPTGAGYTIGCNTALTDQGGYCYRTDGTDAVVYARAESKSYATTAKCAAGAIAWIVWSSADGKSGLTCVSPSTADPGPGLTGLK